MLGGVLGHYARRGTRSLCLTQTKHGGHESHQCCHVRFTFGTKVHEGIGMNQVNGVVCGLLYQTCSRRHSGWGAGPGLYDI